MNVSDFNFELPSELVAQYPPDRRGDSRLLKLRANGDIVDADMADMLAELHAGDLLVLNNTKVVPARLFGQKESGGRIELLLERVSSEHEFVAQIRASKAPKIGQTLQIDGDASVTLTVIGRKDSFFIVTADQVGSLFDWFEKVGHMPLPPYIERADDGADLERYQTVFAKEQGAVAAPTAGLHYDLSLLNKIEQKGVQIEYVTLHVGAGTYQPVRVDKIEEHVMHSESIEVSVAVCDAVHATKARGGRVVAVGTTVVRSLETAARAADTDIIGPYSGETDIFIFPGYKFKVVDLLQTNFHLPESTLLMLVSAFAGYENIMNAYQHAVDQRYRFFSYGDAMLLQRVE